MSLFLNLGVLNPSTEKEKSIERKNDINKPSSKWTFESTT
jgi:hypothetical protein